MWSWLQTLRWHRVRGEQLLRAVVVPGGSPYRQQPAKLDLERERTADPASLAQLLAALDDAGVRYQRRRHGFDLLGRNGRAMPVRVRDVEWITPGELRCGGQAPELVLDLALALVPLFGPLLAEVPFAGSILVDGHRDRGELREEAARVIQQFGRRIAPHAPMSYPLLLDLVHRMRSS
jgi:hypothetical protein